MLGLSSSVDLCEKNGLFVVSTGAVKLASVTKGNVACDVEQ